ncbi:polysaccharide pyruvyl transferase family protein [Empedobacter stercoris]|uniref:polysaccharide pyruvyl transferase family protein n=1 Tax=Empedobacter stercoris TaxID=1628248 RepID=UPI001CE1BBC4|nr:polysaccharide pyruvyl transferase family protein [Empedobacter stercoris]MCA4776705.1 polysaccharide pyruvyl transferase family protein [Empedobacter stercoris]
MKAIIVPRITDLNKGDQALVWESHRLVKDTGLYNEVYILNSGGDNLEHERLCKQSEDRGFKFIDNILPHPRRDKHNNDEHIKESKSELFRLVKNATNDFIFTNKILNQCNDLEYIKKNYSHTIYSTVKHFSEADAIYVKGGGFIHAYGEKTAPYLMWYFLFYIRLAQRLKKKVIIFPNSFGPFDGFTVKDQVKSVLGKVDLLYARENVSSDKLGQLLNKNIKVEMDLGFFLKPGDDDVALSVLKKYNLKEDDKIVGITIRPWRFPGLNNPEELYKKYLDSVEALVKQLLEKKYKVVFCNQSIGPNSHEDDRNAIIELTNKFNNPDVIWLNENLPCDILKTIYSKFNFFIGTRFHSIIFSITSLVPSIAIGYGGNKAKGIMGDFNLDEYVVQIQDVNPTQLCEMFNSLELNQLSVKEELSNKMRLVTESRNRLIGDIKSLY